MKFVMEFEVDNAFFHSEPYYNRKQKKTTLNMSAVGMLVADYGRTIACTGEWSGKIMEGNGNSVGCWRIKRQYHRQNKMRKGVEDGYSQ